MMHKVFMILTWQVLPRQHQVQEFRLTTSVAKSCICSAWFPVHLFSRNTKESGMSVGVIVHCSLVVLLFPAKGQWTTNTRGTIMNWKDYLVAPKDQLSISMLRRLDSKLNSMDPKTIAILYFERPFFFKGDFLENLLFTIFFSFKHDSYRAWDKNYTIITKGHLIVYSQCTFKRGLSLLCTLWNLWLTCFPGPNLPPI